MVRVLVCVCTGSEEIETITPVDLLRRAGAEVVLAASGDSLLVVLSRGVKLQADCLISELNHENWDMIIVPGGTGAGNLRDDEHLINILKQQKAQDRWIASICASPAVVLQTHGLIDPHAKVTCYPTYGDQLVNRSEDRVVRDGKLITSQGPGTSIEFALETIKVLFSEETAQGVATRIIA